MVRSWTFLRRKGSLSGGVDTIYTQTEPASGSYAEASSVFQGSDCERRNGKGAQAPRRQPAQPRAAARSGQGCVQRGGGRGGAGGDRPPRCRHFPTRDALLAAVYRREVEQLSNSADGLLATHPPGQALEAWLHLLVDYMATKRVIAPALRA